MSWSWQRCCLHPGSCRAAAQAGAATGCGWLQRAEHSSLLTSAGPHCLGWRPFSLLLMGPLLIRCPRLSAKQTQQHKAHGCSNMGSRAHHRWDATVRRDSSDHEDSTINGRICAASDTPDRADRCCIGFKLEHQHSFCIPGHSGWQNEHLQDVDDLAASKTRKWMPSCSPKNVLVGVIGLCMSGGAVCSLLSCQLKKTPRVWLWRCVSRLPKAPHTATPFPKATCPGWHCLSSSGAHQLVGNHIGRSRLLSPFNSK